MSVDEEVAQEYVHHTLNQEVTAIGGRYLLLKEMRLPLNGREILYLVGHAAFDSTCCGVSGCAYALVVGFILDWKSGRNKDGLAISLVEPVRAKAVQAKVRRLIEKNELVHQINFQ